MVAMTPPRGVAESGAIVGAITIGINVDVRVARNVDGGALEGVAALVVGDEIFIVGTTATAEEL